jgi:FkbM family methyltransferase
MGVDVYGLELLMRFKSTTPDGLGDALTLGRQGLHFVTDQNKTDAERVIRHYDPGADFQVVRQSGPFAEGFLHYLGCRSVTSLDFSDYEGAEITHDLNRPVPAELVNAFDFILDGGTVEHVFDVAMAYRNIGTMLRTGGLFLGINPANNYLGHGFYQLSPELLWRIFSEENGFTVHSLELVPASGFPAPIAARDPAKVGERVQIGTTPGPVYVTVAARKVAGSGAQVVQQSDYAAQWRRTGAQNTVQVTEPFFPNQPRAAMELAGRLAAETATLPESSRLALFEVFSSCLPSFAPTTFHTDGTMVIAQQRDRQIAFPRPIPIVKLSLIVYGYEQLLQRKYCLPGFVEVEAGDVVVDCGAYVGGFSLSAANTAAHVHAFEPDRANVACLRRNFAHATNISLNEAGLFSHSRTMSLNISTSSVEHSLLAPDDGQVIESRDIDVVSLQDYAGQHGVTGFDFVKIEAEGVELEVFEGLGDLRPRKLAIDVSPERDGVSPADEFRGRLTPLGYEIRQRGNVMFAKLRS